MKYVNLSIHNQQDIINMQEILWKVKPELIIETGIAHGGSLVFMRARLELIGGNGIAKGIDIDVRYHNRIEIEKHQMFKRITMIEGSSTDENIIKKVRDIASSRKTVMVALDSNHTHEYVLRELDRVFGTLFIINPIIFDLADRNILRS